MNEVLKGQMEERMEGKRKSYLIVTKSFYVTNVNLELQPFLSGHVCAVKKLRGATVVSKYVVERWGKKEEGTVCAR